VRKVGLKERIEEERKIQIKERTEGAKEEPNDFEKLLVSNPDQSGVWIEYMAYMLENLDVQAGRRVAERAVRAVSISNDREKLNLWIAFINLENSFGSQESLQKVVARAIEINDRKKVYLQLTRVYLNSKKYHMVEDIFRLLAKKYNFDPEIWRKYLETMFELA